MTTRARQALQRSVPEAMNTACPYIFLDVDGVLNSYVWVRLHPPAALTPPSDAVTAWREHALDPACVARLAHLIELTGAGIVLSSTWRHRMSAGEFARLLALNGFRDAPVVGATGNEPGPRGGQVAAWLEAHAPSATYVCIDDDGDFLPGQPLVRTDPETGLTDADVEACSRMLQVHRRY